MSRIGKKPILIPRGVEVKFEDGEITAKGPKGEISKKIASEVRVDIKGNEIIVSAPQESKKVKALWGTCRALINNIIEGVNSGYEKKLQLEGIGYRAGVEGDDLVMQVGFSHPVRVKKVEGIKFSVEKNIITVTGIDKETVGQTAAKIRAIKKPEPYKGKGIRYVGEHVRKKAGKKVVAAAA